MKAKKFKRIDYGFRPKSYRETTNPLQAILRNVKGTNRRQMIPDYWEAGRIEELDTSYVADSLDDDLRERLEQINPSFMGGEYLPPYQASEVEIARIELQSTTADIISVRAQSVGKRIAYSICDEYESNFKVSPTSSNHPLTLEELIGLIDHAGFNRSLGLDYTIRNYESGDRTIEDLERLKHFTEVESIFYPQITAHYRRLVQSWYLEEKKRLAEPHPLHKRL